jgi:CBS domain-containing protein
MATEETSRGRIRVFKVGGITIAPDTPLIDALKKMAKGNVSRLLVMRGDEMMGMITQTGLLHFVEIKRAVEEHA